ncbi:hypothetical protein K501DRAFT_217284 [Backusella circina FSU 941]|nr:hypothetical protein K501DRAFT_217284 [Backusella circina FSU 941]
MNSSEKKKTRRYATPEESDATIPIFNTPTTMYTSARAYAGPVPLPKKYNYAPYTPKSPETAYKQEAAPPKPPKTEPKENSYTKRESYQQQPKPTPKHDTTLQKDKILAQLVDMGFTLEASKVAYDASTNGKDLQSVLDVLVQNQKAEKENKVVDSSGDEDDDSQAVDNKEQEEIWRKQQEERRKEYLDEMKRNKPTPPMPNVKVSTPESSHTSTNDNSFNSNTTSPRRHQPSPFFNAHPFQNSSSSPYSNTRKSSANQNSYSSPKPPASSYTSPPLNQNAFTSSTHKPPRNPSSSFPPDPILISVDLERKQGNYLFNQGKVAEAEASYTLAMSFLPPLHDQLVILSNNRAAARLKQGKFQECLQDCATAVGIAQNNMQLYGNDAMDLHNQLSWKSQVIKALHRKACALEGLKLYDAAIQVYEDYVRLDGSRGLEVSQGIQRCKQAMQKSQDWKPADKDTSSFPDIDFNIFIPRKETPVNLEEINNSKAVKEMREREKKKEKEEMERLEKQDKVDAQIVSWRMGKERNLRALLSSLDSILWPGVQWKSVTMTDLLEPKRCKITYMKAIAKVHPDKLPSSATVEQRLLASSIFTCLNQAWDLFKTENNF